MPLTPSQKAAVDSAHEPLFIQAGAGTGKTFTLTKRIAHGLSQQSGPLIEAVDRLLTITFTNKAAAELIGRVRAELRAQGLSEESLQIDAAWISTIHAMCRRMLLAHAFDVGIDPGAKTLSEEESRALSALALDSLLADLAGDARLEALVSQYGPQDAPKLIQSLSELFALAPDGIEGFSLGPAPARASRRYVQDLAAFLMQTASDIDGLGLPETPAYQKNRDKLAATIEELDGWLHAEGEPAWIDIACLLERCGAPSGGNFRAPFKELFNACRNELARLQAIARSAVAYGQLQAAASLALEHLRRHAQLKRERGALDTNDLLIAAYRLLAQDASVAREYREKFQSIMVDEFQDTDSLQVGIVWQICDDALSTLATVGDAQQSIYGFRGADLEVYQDMRRVMREHGSKEVELTVNYRSQPDILRFVEDIFSTPEFFGGEFLEVSSGRSIGSDPPWLSADEPRVKILMSAGTKDGRRSTPVGRLRVADAAAVVDEFERLHGQGASYGDMAILVQSTKGTRTSAYLDELRRRGIPCVISGGSDFFLQPEVTIVSMLLRVIANRDDDEALYELLASDFFDASDDDLLELSTVNKQWLKLVADESRAKPSLYDALERIVNGPLPDGSPAGASMRLRQALRVIDRALELSQSLPLAQVVRDAVIGSGWKQTLASRGIEGGAVFANVERACDWIEDFETLNGRAPFAASEFFRDLIDSAQEGAGVRAKPGTLVSTGQDAVQIMTIHSSKGLEFPIVAVAEFEKSAGGSGSKLISLSENGRRFLALESASEATTAAQDLFAEPSLARAADASEYQAHARRLKRQREMEEAQRLLYVALTRARDVLLFVTHDSGFASKGTLSNGLAADSLRAIFDDEVPRESRVFRTQSGALVEYRLTEVLLDGSECEEERQDEKSLVVEHRLGPVLEAPRISALAQTQRKIHSYSSIAHRAQESVAPVAQSIVLPDRSSRADTVSPVGSAFHVVAQWLAVVPAVHGQALDARLQAVAKRYGLDEDAKHRLVDAVRAWVSSSCFAKTQGYEQRRSEYAFCVDVEGVALEGYIDLLCFDSNGDALVVDYKTGTSGQGEDLHDRYALQAACYAYALLSTGFCTQLEMSFVRPEADMEEVRFSFDASDVPALAKQILA